MFERHQLAQLGLGTALLAGSFAAPASAFMLNSTTGTWSNVQGGANIQFVTVGDESQVRWGEAATTAGSSGLGFTGVGALDFAAETVFQIGTLRHFNNPIFGGTAAAAVDLSLNLDFADLGLKSFDFTLTIDETPNSGTCTYFSVTPCADKIAWTNSLAAQTFQVDGVDYTLELLGVRESLSGSLLANFISQEGGTSAAFLVARLTDVTPAPPNSIPEPGLLLGLGAITTFVVTHRRPSS
ncbi:MAG: hypothetical protein HC910_12955 [Spirulinaceae cyanobacterium SM2_1_0]|nr:hypothetical protein [Spirulinaceae cyanobacterium SM2_1_0]